MIRKTGPRDGQLLLVWLFLECSLCTCLHSDTREFIVPPETLNIAPYPEWAHHHWVWLSNDRANQTSMIQYAKDYLDYGVQVGAVDIDSGWSTGFNNFEFDTNKYTNATEMIEFFHSKNIRIILWATSMINTDSSNYNEAYDNGYLIKDVFGRQALFSWWHGKGGLIDYSNPKALQWWHSQMDKALNLGIDGWKCDGTDPYILELVIPIGKEGVVTRRKYSDAYYGDFFNYTRQKLGDDRLVMSRPADGFGPIFLDFSPRYVMYSGWVGDDDPTFEGLESALKSYLQSAWAGYANFGSDIGGYRSGNGNLGRTKELFIRWSQLGAFSPLMENGGNKEHRPWMFDNNNETLNIYNKFVTAHYEMVPYLLTTGAEAFDKRRSSITPLAKHNNFIEKIIDDFKPSTYNYMLGVAVFVAPIINNASSFSLTLPPGHSWMYWWNHSVILSGGSEVKFNGGVPLDEFPVYVIDDTFIPLRVTDKTSLLPTNQEARTDYSSGPAKPGMFTGYLMWFMHSPHPNTADPVQSIMREEKGGGMATTHWWPSLSHMIVTISAHSRERSLLEIVGLRQAVVAIGVQKADKSIQDTQNVASVDKLGLLDANEAGYVQYCCGGHCSVLVYPGREGKNGHFVHVYF